MDSTTKCSNISLASTFILVAVHSLAVLLAAVPANCNAQAHDPLPSWNDGPTKQAIVEFVTQVTTEGSKDFVPVAERVATFDNDGTLWVEKPVYAQLAFAVDRVRAMAKEHPEWKTTMPFSAILADDIMRMKETGVEDILKIVAATHANTTPEEFAKIVTEWLNTAKHPRFDRPYQELTYKPMLELLGYLRDNEFKTFIVSGGGIEFLRVFAEEAYGIPPEQVIGSSIKTKIETRDGKPSILRLSEIDFIDDKEGKPLAINRHIGRRPIAAFGNSDGDLKMLEYAAAGKGRRFCMIVHHTDSAREWAYDRQSYVGKLDKALEESKRRNWVVADMKQDWKVVFQSDHPYLHKKETAHAAHWSYSGETGPKHWGDLDPKYAIAKSGKQQSPIDINKSVEAALPKIEFNYKPTRIHLVYNGHTIQENEDSGSFALAGENRYELQQFHFHSPSEHTVEGKHFPMEMHFVHKSQDGSIGVVAVFIEEGQHNDAFDPVWFALPNAANPHRDANFKIDTAALLPEDHSYFAYEGSFTTPPCTERVKWIVLSKPISLSKTQIDRFRAVIDGNNRPVQPLNGRSIFRSE